MLSVGFMAINVVLARKSYVLFGMKMTECKVYGPKCFMLMLQVRFGASLVFCKMYAVRALLQLIWAGIMYLTEHCI